MGTFHLTHEARRWYDVMSHKHGGLVISKIHARAKALAIEEGSTYLICLAYYKRAWRELLPEVSKLPGFDDRLTSDDDPAWLNEQSTLPSEYVNPADANRTYPVRREVKS